MSSKRELAVLALLVPALACSGSKPAPAASGTDTAQVGGASISGKPAIGWPVPSSVKVRERTDKGRGKSELEYSLHACPRPEGGFTVAHRDFKVVSIGGVPGSDPRLAAAAEQLAPLMAAIPRFVVDANGRFRDIDGLEEMIQGVEKSLARTKLERVRELLSDPKQLPRFRLAAASRWSAWVETWLAYDPALGQRQRVQHAAPVPGVDRGAGELAFEGRTPDGAARLAASSRLDGDDAKRAIVAELAGLQLTKDDLDAMMVSASYRVDVETEWPNVRPYRAKSQKVLRVDVRGQTIEAEESYDWVFDWGSKSAQPDCR